MHFKYVRLFLRCSTTLSIQSRKFSTINNRISIREFRNYSPNIFTKVCYSNKTINWNKSPQTQNDELDPKEECIYSDDEFDPKDIELLEHDYDMFEDDEASSYMNIDYQAVTNGDEELIKKLKLFQLEVDVLAQQGEKVPKKMRSVDWQSLLNLETRSARYRHLNFLWKNELRRESDRLRRKERSANYQIAKEKRKAEGPIEFKTNSPVRYGLQYITLFHRIYPADINRLYNWKLLQASMFAPTVVIDCEYENFMNQREHTLTAKQMLYLWSENRDSLKPFHILFTGFNPHSSFGEKLIRYFPTFNDPTYPFNYTEKSYLELFPKEKLVYLTPHCTEMMETYNPDDVYIIGALVDKSRTEPVSLAKAKKQKLRMAKFPIDRYLNWGQGVKTLTLNQCTGILNDLKETQNWDFAFRRIPRRKLANSDLSAEELEHKTTRSTAKSIREQYRRNLVYDLLLDSKAK